MAKTMSKISDQFWKDLARNCRFWRIVNTDITMNAIADMLQCPVQRIYEFEYGWHKSIAIVCVYFKLGFPSELIPDIELYIERIDE